MPLAHFILFVPIFKRVKDDFNYENKQTPFIKNVFS
jgi:hypothetical protein